MTNFILSIVLILNCVLGLLLYRFCFSKPRQLEITNELEEDLMFQSQPLETIHEESDPNILRCGSSLSEANSLLLDHKSDCSYLDDGEKLCIKYSNASATKPKSDVQHNLSDDESHSNINLDFDPQIYQLQKVDPEELYSIQFDFSEPFSSLDPCSQYSTINKNSSLDENPRWKHSHDPILHDFKLGTCKSPNLSLSSKTVPEKYVTKLHQHEMKTIKGSYLSPEEKTCEINNEEPDISFLNPFLFSGTPTERNLEEFQCKRSADPNISASSDGYQSIWKQQPEFSDEKYKKHYWVGENNGEENSRNLLGRLISSKNNLQDIESDAAYFDWDVTAPDHCDMINCYDIDN